MKVVFVCSKDGHIEVSKVTDKQHVSREKKCPKCSGAMNFIRKNKKKYKLMKKQLV